MKSTKELNKLTIFLQSACTNDGRREQLDRVNITDKHMIATDGFKLHATPTPEAVTERGCYFINNGKARVSDQSLNFHDPTDKEFPDFTRVLPNSESAYIAMDARKLASTLKHFDGGVIIKIRSKTEPIEIFGTVQGEQAYALIMPMHIDLDAHTYRPGE